jgi:hypothetical protein
MASAPLSTAPLSTAPLSTGPLSTGPLSTGPLSTGPLSTGPLSPGLGPAVPWGSAGRAGGRGFGTGDAATVIRPARPRPGPARSPDPPDDEHHQDHQPERDARRHDIQSEPGHMRGLVLGYHAHDHAGGYQDDADHDRYGGRHRQGDDEPHPLGRGGSRAHCSTIASRLPARKPNGQL